MVLIKRLKNWRRDEVFELIKIVQNEEAVYNPQNKNYSSREYVKRFWMRADIRLKKYPGSSLQKWMLMRSQFRKEHEKVEQGQVPSRNKSYDALKFLIPYLRRTTFSIDQVLDDNVRNALRELQDVTRNKLQKNADIPLDNEDCNNEIEEDTSNIQKYEEAVEVNHEVSSEPWVDDNTTFQIEDIDDSPTEHEYPSNGIVEHEETLQYTENPEKLSQDLHVGTVEEVTNVIEQSHTNPSTSSSSDICACGASPDAMFLLSLLPDIQNLPKKDKGQFKLTVQKLLQDMLYSNDES